MSESALPFKTPVQVLAGEAYSCFESATRNYDDSFVRIKEGSPEWVTDLAHHAHGNMFPDDWRYQTIMSVLECISESDDPEDAAHEWADAEVDVYTDHRLEWLSSHLHRPGYCDEAREEMYGTELPTNIGIIEQIGLGQYDEATEVFQLVWSFLRDRADDGN